MNVDSLLVSLGGWTKFHLLLYALLSTITLRSSWHIYGISFAAGKGNFTCLSAEGLNTSAVTSAPSQCSVTDLESNTTYAECTAWEHELPDKRSIISEWNLVCDRSGYITADLTVFMIGHSVGALVLSGLADRYGRKKVLTIALGFQSVCSIICIFSVNMIMFTIVRFFIAFLNPVTMTCVYVLLTEWFPASQRALAANSMQLFWAISIMVTPLLAWLAQDSWRLLLTFYAIPQLIFITFPCLLPESLYYLNDRGDEKGLKYWALWAGRTAGVDMRRALAAEEDFVIDLKRQSLDENEKGDLQLVIEQKPQQTIGESAFASFTDCRVFFCLAVLVWLWITLSFTYYVSTFLSYELYGDTYVNIFLSGLVEVPGMLLVTALSSRVPRLTLLVSSLLFSATCFGVTTILPVSTFRSFVTIVSKGGVAGAYIILYLAGAELFPTPMRNLGMGICQFSESLGPIFGPYFMHAANDGYYKYIGYMALIFLFNCLLVLGLPEAMGQPLPNCAADVRAFPPHQFLRLCRKKSGGRPAHLTPSHSGNNPAAI